MLHAMSKDWSTARARWGLVAVSGALALALVATALWAWSGARQAADDLTRGRMTTLRTSVSRALRQSPGEEQGTLTALLEDHQDEGLRYLAVVRGGEVWAEAGQPIVRQLPNRDDVRAGLRWVGDRVRHVSAIRGRGKARAKRRGFLVQELEPLAARSLQNRALVGLLVAGLVALVLLGAAWRFWLLERRAARAEEALVRQRHLAALGEMSAVLGHELRNPLASLKGHAQLLSEQLEDGSRERRKADRVVGEAVRLQHLINEVLAFVRSGDVERETVDPRELLRAAADGVPGARVQLDVEGAPTSWSLDATRLERVLVNLVDNAWRATQDAQRDTEVEVSARVVGDTLILTVRDHGSGLPDADLERIFEPFVTTRIQGTGLGLAIARGIATAHGGTLVASNHADGGAVFRLAIPRA